MKSRKLWVVRTIYFLFLAAIATTQAGARLLPLRRCRVRSARRIQTPR